MAVNAGFASSRDLMRTSLGAGGGAALAVRSFYGTGPMSPPSGTGGGFAGGLSPENVASQIEKIQIVTGGADFWIDAETHLRSADDRQFDLTRVRRFLEAAKPYVQR